MRFWVEEGMRFGLETRARSVRSRPKHGWIEVGAEQENKWAETPTKHKHDTHAR